MIDFDYLLSKVGHIGVYQVVVILMVYYFGIPSGLNGLAPVFMAYQPDYRCNVPPIDNKTLYDLTEDEILNMTTPFDEEDEKYKGCERYNYNPEVCYDTESLSCVEDYNDTISCDQGYHYDRSLFTETVVTEFDLVCDNQIFSAIATSIYMFGLLLGSIIWGSVSDRIGRKPTLFITAAGAFVGMIGAALSHVYWLYVLSRLLISFMGFGATLSGFVLVMEIIGPKWRTMVGITFQAVFAIGYMTLSGIAYGWRDWHDMQWACIVLSLPFAFFLFVIPESPRWLFSVERNKAGRRITESMAKYNKALLTEEMWQEAEKIGKEKAVELEKISGEQNEKYYFTDLFKGAGIRRTTYKVMFNWFVNSLVYYGVSLNVGAISGDIFINNVLGGVMELISYMICVAVMDFTGRRILLAIMLLICGVTLCTCAIVNEYSEGNKDLENFGVALAFLGKMGISGSYAIIYNFTTELYPTVVRSNSIGVGSAAARIGGIIAPFVIISQYSVSWLPNAIFGVTAAIAGVLSLSFPDTTGMKMLETLDEAEKFYARKQLPEDTESDVKSVEETKPAYRVNEAFNDVEAQSYL